MHVDVHIRGRPHPGETVSGDAAGVQRGEGVTWVLLLDALGHGPEAAKVGVLALDELTKLRPDVAVVSALRQLSARVEGTRGAAAALLRFRADGIGVVGIGNVELRTLDGASLPYIPAKGILGRRMPARLRAHSLVPEAGGRVVMFTDGIRRPPLHQLTALNGSQLCEALIREHAIDRDDAMVVHVDYQLDPPRT